MGTFYAKFKVSLLTNQKKQALTFLVDTGSSFSVIPEDRLHQLGVKPEYTESFELADGRVIQREVGYIVLYQGAKKVITPVVFGITHTEPLLGALALEGLALVVDTVQRKLKPTRLLMKCNMLAE